MTAKKRRRRKRARRRARSTPAPVSCMHRLIRLDITDGFSCCVCVPMHPAFFSHALNCPGSESSASKSDEQTTEPEEAAREDAFLVLGLLKKDYPRPINTSTLDGLATRQLAYTIAGITDQMMASDVLECRGDIVSGLHILKPCVIPAQSIRLQ